MSTRFLFLVRTDVANDHEKTFCKRYIVSERI
jgi:hypothetical protein